MIDIHSHVLPGVDDGSESMEMSLDMLAIAADSGVRTLVATPHCNIPWEFDNYLSPELEELFLELQREAAREELAGRERVLLTEPLDVVDFHNLIARSFFVMTDSGGIQEEAPALGKPVLVLRDTTERPEGVLAGTLKLVGTAEEDVYHEAKRLLTDREAYLRMSRAVNPYGDGHAAARIADAIGEVFSLPKA